MDSSVISFDGGADSDAFSPEVKKAKAAPKKAAAATKPKVAPKAAPKKTTQTTLKTIATKKRAKPDSEDDENTDQDDDSLLSKQSGTPPNAKKQKVAPVKKSSGKPLGQIDNESYDVDSVAEGRPASAKKNKTGTEQYQKVCYLHASLLHSIANTIQRSHNSSTSSNVQTRTLDQWKGQRPRCGSLTLKQNQWSREKSALCLVCTRSSTRSW